MADVDILMATYNGQNYICEQIKSLQAQSYENWELLISDDCSSDNTLDIVSQFSEQDARIRIVSKGTRFGSAKSNFLYLLSQAKSPYVMFCDQDDVWLPNKIEISLDRIQSIERSHESNVPCLVFTDMTVVDSDLNIIDDSFTSYSNINPLRTSFSHMLAQSVGAGCTMMINKAATDLARIGGTNDNIIMHDWWLCIICSAFGAIDYVDKSTSLYRQHSANDVGAIRFSLLCWAKKIGTFKYRQAAISKQAEYFEEVFNELLSDNQRGIVKYCANACKGSPVQNFSNLIKSKAWKSGTRKIGQIIAVIDCGFHSNI